MKNKIITSSLLVALALCGCSQEDGIANFGQDNGNRITIKASREELPSTKTEYDDSDPAKLVVKWKNDKSDRIGVFATNSTAANALFAVDGDLSADGKIANFTGTLSATDPNAAMTLYSYYPYNEAQKDSHTIAIDLLGQTQTAINATDHLAAFDFMAATPVVYNKATDINSVPMVFNPLLTVMSFDVANTLSSQMTVRSISLEAVESMPFYTKGIVDITDKNLPVTPSGVALSRIELNVDNVSIAAGKTGRFSMMMFPVATGPHAKYRITVVTANGKKYIQEKSLNTDFQRGKRYIVAIDQLSEAVEAPGTMQFLIKVDHTNGLDFSIPFPTTGSTPAEIRVDWGDGKSEVVSAGTPLSASDRFNHTYAAARNYLITITSAQTDPASAQMPHFSFCYLRNGADDSNCKKLIRFDTPLLNAGANNLARCFENCSSLSSIPVGLFDKNTQVTDFRFCFYGCTSLSSIPAGLFDHNPQVTDFRSCFYNCSSLSSIPVGLFDKNTQVTTFDGCFSRCNSLGAIPAGLFDHNPQVTDFRFCFSSCSSLGAIPAGLFDKNTQVTDFSSCFSFCRSLSSIPAGLFDYNPQVMDFGFCFSRCNSLGAIPAGLFDKNTQVTDFISCFQECTSLGTIPAGLFDHNPQVMDFRSCFSGCKSLGTIPAGLFEKNTDVTEFGSCFSWCSSLGAIPAGLFDHNPQVTTFDGCFFSCKSLGAIPAELFDHNPQVTDFSGCFSGCTSLGTIPAGLFDHNPQVMTFGSCFQACSSLGAIPAGLFDHNPQVTDFSVCFQACTSLGAIPVGLFDENLQATAFIWCFSECTSLILNEKIFSSSNDAAVRQGRFKNKAMDFSFCFSNVGSRLTDEELSISIAPDLWNYDKGTASWGIRDCFGGSSTSNAADIPDEWRYSLMQSGRAPLGEATAKNGSRL